MRPILATGPRSVLSVTAHALGRESRLQTRLPDCESDRHPRKIDGILSLSRG